jgi:hypothetical protein
MIRYRPFLNSDPPAIAAVWRQQTWSRAVMQPMTAWLLDQLVLAKPYFDRRGLLLAWDDDSPVGFAHAGFGPHADGEGIDRRHGLVCLVMVAPHPQRAQIAAGLLSRCEEYLGECGAETVYGGCLQELSPFYLGLYGGSRSPGVLDSDAVQLELFREAGYQTDREFVISQLQLTGFRPPVDRALVQLKRQCRLEPALDVPPASWWEACTFGQIDRMRLVLAPVHGGPEWGVAEFWDMEPLASSWAVHAMGLLRMTVQNAGEASDQNALATCLLQESIRHLHSYGVTLIEVQTESTDRLLIDACQRLGFLEVGRGLRFVKPVCHDRAES